MVSQVCPGQFLLSTGFLFGVCVCVCVCECVLLIYLFVDVPQTSRTQDCKKCALINGGYDWEQKSMCPLVDL